MTRTGCHGLVFQRLQFRLLTGGQRVAVDIKHHADEGVIAHDAGEIDDGRRSPKSFLAALKFASADLAGLKQLVAAKL